MFGIHLAAGGCHDYSFRLETCNNIEIWSALTKSDASIEVIVQNTASASVTEGDSASPNDTRAWLEKTNVFGR
jgi:hypothetical protein